MRYLGVFLIFTVVFSACPNNCNGHGKCNSGKCECFRSVGLESIPNGGSTSAATTYNIESYYGPDCSRKMCPLGISFATVRETGYAIDLAAGAAGTSTPIPQPDRRMDDLAVKGEAGQPAPTADGSNGGTGVPANHMYVECSGAGLCNEETGTCECFDGFEGKACQRMACPNGCSGKGKCVPINAAVGLDGTANDIKELYGFNGRMKYDKTQVEDSDSEAKFFGCLCDKGFRGPDCSLRECPSGEDPEGATNIKNGNSGSKVPDLKVEHRDCSGRGRCNYEKGECECFDGFGGASCSMMNEFM